MNPNNQITTEAQFAAKAIGYTENGGKPNLANPSKGKSGELKSIFQYTPDTWAKDSQEVFGKKNVPLNNDTETYVTTQMIEKWLKAGKTLPQIFSSWNAGTGEPDAYTGKFSNGAPSVGRNKEGVSFNVPAYVKTAMGYYDQFSKGSGGDTGMASASPTSSTPANGEPSLATNSPSQTAPQGETTNPQQYKDAIATIVSLVKKGQKTPQQKGQAQQPVATASGGLLPSKQPALATGVLAPAAPLS